MASSDRSDVNPLREDDARSAAPHAAGALGDPVRLHLLAETDLVEASATARLPTLDRIARLAARALRVPVAQVNLLSAESQIPAAAFVDPGYTGPDGEPLDAADADLGGAWRTPVALETSYCRHLVDGCGTIAIEDAERDALVRDNPSTREGGIRSYAAVPVVAPGGAVLGSVCVVDFRPRAWSPADLAALEECALLAGEEVAARLGADAALRESDERLRLAMQAARLGSWSLDLRTNALTTSSRCRENFGRGPDEPFTYDELMAAVHAEDRARVQAAVRRAIETRTDYAAEYRAILPDGSERWIAAYGHPLYDGAGAPRRMVGLTQDVSDRIRARRESERLLAESERARAEAESARESMEALLASIGDPFYLLDRDWRFTYVNDAAEPLLQTTREALLGRTLWEAFPGVAGSAFEGPYREAMETGRGTSAEAYFEPLGTWFDVRSYPWTGGLMVHFRDIGARKAAEVERERLVRALDLERARLEEVFRRAPSFIVAFRGANLVYEFVNEAYYQLVGHRAILGKPLLEAIPEIRGQGFDAILGRVLETGEAWVGRETPVQLQRTPGAPLETRYLDMVFQALAEADGTRSGVVVHGSDITAQVLTRREVERLLGVSERAREEAEAARRDADAANRAKSEFLAVMSHELRTPLNAIGGYAELLEMGIRGPITEQQREDLRRVQASQRHLLGLINEVLNYAKLETGNVRYDTTTVPLREALAAAEALVAPQARAKSLTLVLADGPRGLAARADAEKLRQILVNLLSNAIKFTDARDGRAGRIELSCAADGDRVVVRVRDTGIGIPADKVGAIFDPFVQVRADLTRTAEGTGLGLAISRDLARGMGGDLTVESRLGVGSTFTLALPRAHDE